MHKKLWLCIGLASLLTPFAAFAEEQPTQPTVWDGFSGFLSPDWSRDFSASVGVKVWVNEWSRDSFISSGFETSDGAVVAKDTAPDTQESDIEPVPIPQLGMRYKWLFVTGSYYAKTGFDFDDTQALLQADFDGDGFEDARSTSVFSTSGDRYEWDASGGVYVHPYVAILGGYKKVRQEINSSATSTLEEVGLPAVTQTATFFSDLEIEGPTIGIAGSVPIGGGFGMYASYAHGFMDAKIRDVGRSPPTGASRGEFDADYDVAELGFTYTYGLDRLMPDMPLSSATAYAGYRYQNISTDFEEPADEFTVPPQDRSDVTRGFVVGVNLNF